MEKVPSRSVEKPKSNDKATLETIERFIYMVYDAAVEGLKAGASVQPNILCLFAEKELPDGGIERPAVSYPFVFETHEEKEAVLKRIGFSIASYDRDMICAMCVSEAWASEARPDGSMGLPPSLDPNRFEMLVISAMLKDGRRKILTFKINRGDKVEVEPCGLENDHMGVWMAAEEIGKEEPDDRILTGIWKDYRFAMMVRPVGNSA